MTDAPPMLTDLLPQAPSSPPRRPRLSVEEVVLAVEENVVIRPQVTPETTHLAITTEDWQWDQLRDYVVTEIEKVVGVFPRQEPYKEKAIFAGFLNRHGIQASAIARYAFEHSGGYWKNAPISVNRFCAGSDEYFANPIKKHLAEAQAAKAARV